MPTEFDNQQYLAENPNGVIGSPEYWASQGRGAENPTLGMTPDELTNFNYTGDEYGGKESRESYYRDLYNKRGGPQELNNPDYAQPGSPGYVTPKTQAEIDTFWADPKTDKSLYLMSPEQFAKLTPQQQSASMESFEYQYDPRYPIVNGKIHDNNIAQDSDGWLSKIARGIVIGGLTAGVGNALGFTLPSIPGLDSGVTGGSTGGLGGVPVPGLESGLFPYTTLPPTGLESSLFPMTTPGAGLGTVPAWGVGGSTIPGLGGPDLGSNLGSGGSSLWQNGKDAYDIYKKGRTGLGIVNQLTGGNLLGGNQGGGTQKQTQSQPDWSKLFSAAAFAPAVMIPKQTIIPDDPVTAAHQQYESEAWQGLTPEQTSINMKDGGNVNEHVMVDGPENRKYARHAKRGFHVKGIGTGQSDEIPTMLAKDEYVIDSDTVSALGDGSSEAGAAVLDKMREEIRKHKRSAPVDKIPPPAKSPLEYMGRKS